MLNINFGSVKLHIDNNLTCDHIIDASNLTNHMTCKQAYIQLLHFSEFSDLVPTSVGLVNVLREQVT